MSWKLARGSQGGGKGVWAKQDVLESLMRHYDGGWETPGVWEMGRSKSRWRLHVGWGLEFLLAGPATLVVDGDTAACRCCYCSRLLDSQGSMGANL